MVRVYCQWLVAMLFWYHYYVIFYSFKGKYDRQQLSLFIMSLGKFGFFWPIWASCFSTVCVILLLQQQSFFSVRIMLLTLCAFFYFSASCSTHNDLILGASHHQRQRNQYVFLVDVPYWDWIKTVFHIFSNFQTWKLHQMYPYHKSMQKSFLFGCRYVIGNCQGKTQKWLAKLPENNKTLKNNANTFLPNASNWRIND